ncbi:MAG TPA: hypothetical protein VFA45_02180, partial [Actinomycetes bacterium]|nr:hypothetical protein [Actinomycetes bacterium]
MSAAAQSDDPAAFYRAVCAGRRSGDPALQSSWALPHHREPGADPNAAGVRNSLSRLPQTQGLVNAQEAQRHLDAHMAVIRGEASADDLQLLSEEHVSPETELELGQHVTLDLPETELTTLSLPQRRMGLRLLEYNKVVTHPRYGPLMFEPGAFVTDLHSGSVDPVVVRLRMDHEDPPTGLGRTFTDKPDAPYMEFQLSRTQRADEQLTLAKD